MERERNCRSLWFLSKVPENQTELFNKNFSIEELNKALNDLQKKKKPSTNNNLALLTCFWEPCPCVFQMKNIYPSGLGSITDDSQFVNNSGDVVFCDLFSISALVVRCMSNYHLEILAIDIALAEFINHKELSFKGSDSGWI